MQITIEIPDNAAKTILAMLTTLMKPSSLEAQPEPAEVHPELPVKMSVEKWVASRLPTPDDKRPRLIPVLGNFYWTRHGVVIRAERITLNGDIECSCDDGPFYYLPDGTPRAAAVCSPDWDVVEECPF